jgi:hypothetical protein
MAAEPTIREVEMNLFAQAALGANAEAVAHDQHTDHEFRVDRRPARVTVVRREMLAKFVELEVAINAAQQVRAGNMIIKVE